MLSNSGDRQILSVKLYVVVKSNWLQIKATIV